MKQNMLSVALVILSVLGMLDAGYVSYETLTNRIPRCIPPFECGVVLESQWSKIAGVPLALYGLFFYAVVFILAVMNLTEVTIKIPVVKTVKNSLYLLTTFGFCFSLYLMFIQQFVIHAWCLWCLISAVTTTSLFVVAMLLKGIDRKTLQ
jgi:uncharacterized membrane protein